MAWIAENRRNEAPKQSPEAMLTEEMKKHLAEKYLPRYATKRAVVLPALHYIQHTYNYIPAQAMEELANFLELQPAEILDTASFYEEFWLKPKGKYVVSVCRSLACEICGSKEITAHLKKRLGIDVSQTTEDGRFTLVELECLGSCGTAPVVGVNEVLHENVTIEQLDQTLDALPNNPAEYKDPSISWPLDEH